MPAAVRWLAPLPSRSMASRWPCRWRRRGSCAAARWWWGLDSVVAAGQDVTVTYTDPTTGNDDRAIQDPAGNDAATLTDQMVTNASTVTG